MVTDPGIASIPADRPEKADLILRILHNKNGKFARRNKNALKAPECL